MKKFPRQIKKRAQWKISKQIKTGKRKPARTFRCVDCGKKAQCYDHYMGYAPRYHKTVEPVCTSCHAKRHVRRGDWKGNTTKGMEHPNWKGGISLDRKKYARRWAMAYRAKNLEKCRKQMRERQRWYYHVYKKKHPDKIKEWARRRMLRYYALKEVTTKC